MKPRIIDSDTHVIEKRDTWESRLPRAWGDNVMHMVYDERRGMDIWVIGDRQVAFGWPQAHYGARYDSPKLRRYPQTQEFVHPACYDAGERVKVMDRWGIESAVLFPNSTGFSLERYMARPDPEIAVAHVSAYNDFLVEEWVSAAPGRFIPMATIPFWNLERAVREVERIADKGFGGVTTTGAPQIHGQPYMSDRHWDPLWSVLQDAGLAVAFHIGNADPGALEMPMELRSQEPDEVMEARETTRMYMSSASQTVDLLLSGVLPRFPGLRFLISESGLGWVPFVLENCDHRFKNQGFDLSYFGGMLPSELFRRQISVNCFFERVTQWHLDRIGIDNIMFETDLPHPAGFYFTGSDDFQNDGLEPVLGQLTPEQRHQILWKNPARMFAKALEQQGVNLTR
jgi:predicted TIM-barrel fold metal-dependent hydrolase